MGSTLIVTSNSTWSWSVPAPQTIITAELLGGGGAGGGVSATNAAGGGGRGGSYVKVTITKGAESVLVIDIGASAVGSTAAGAAGGYSRITQNGTVIALAPGGNGGGGGSGATAYTGATGDNGTA